MLLLAGACLAGILLLLAQAVRDDRGAGPAVAFRPAGQHSAVALAIAREESGVRRRPATGYALPGGELRLPRPELLASASGQPIEFRLRVARRLAGASLVVRLPRRWLRRGPGGLPTTDPPRLRRRAGGRARLARAGAAVRLSIRDARPGDVASFALTDVGIPAGSYDLPLFWHRSGGSRIAAGSARVVLYAPAREPTDLPDPGVAENVTADSTEESETFIAVDPSDKDRIAVGVNWQAASMSAWISGDGGHTWVRRTLPQTIDAPGKSSPESGSVCCDPTFAADDLGNIWFGGLSLSNGASNPSRIVVNRIGAGTDNFQSQTTGLKTRTSGTQDKPMMTIDGSPSSPAYGRLYAVWDEPASGGVNLVISQCDTRPGGAPDAAHCDNADSWSTPVSVTPATGSYIYGDVAAGPDGRVYVTWWDYSSTNAIRGDVCDPSSQNCASAAGWGTPQTITTLDATGGKPVPFICPILAQPGGRASTSPQVEVDRSGGAQNDRVYVTWSDLRPGSGTTRCAVKPNGDGTAPRSTDLTFDSYVASAPNGSLPGGSNPSESVATRLLSGAEGALTADDWFAWLAVDQSTGQAWADFYSTRDDSTRNKTNFYARSVTPTSPTATSHSLGTLKKVSQAQSDYSANQCCKFGNDYGDYTGIAAAQGIASPVWSDNSTGDGEAYTFVSQPTAPPPSAVTGAADSIGQTTATLHGNVNPHGAATDYHFEYGVDNGASTVYSSTPAQNAGSGTSNVSVSANLTGLTAGTAYRYRLVASSGSGITTGAELTFSTAFPPPAVTTGSADAIGEATATVHGSVNPNGVSTSYHFEYGVDNGGLTVYTSTATQSAGSGTSAVPVSANLSGLADSTTYRYRLVASSSAGSTTGSEQTFTTATPPPPSSPPTVATGAADGIGESTATLHGTVNPNGQATTYYFEYGTTAAYGMQIPDPAAGAGSDGSDHALSATPGALSPGTTYHFRIVAANDSGTAIGDDHSFQTAAPPPPTVGTGSADAIGESTATLHGMVNPNGLATSYHFEYGLDAGGATVYASTPTQSAGAGTSAVPVSAALSSLASGTTYRYRLVAANGSGPTTGSEATFKTAAPAPPPPPPVPTATAPVHRLVKGEMLGARSVPIRLVWSVSDGDAFAKPIESSPQRQMRQADGWGGWSTVAGPIAATRADLMLAPSARDRRFRIEAEDQVEQVGTGSAGRAFDVAAIQDSSRRVAYAGAWRRIPNAAANGGSLRSATRRGATATVGFRGRNAAVVMPLRSILGAVRICLDPGTAGQLCRAVDLSPAAGLGPRRMVFSRNGLPASVAHRLRITVLSGRVDLDAFVVLG